MPLDRFVLIIIVVLVATGAAIWLGALVVSAVQFPIGWLGLLPAGFAVYVAWRVISERLSNREDDHYDRIEK